MSSEKSSSLEDAKGWITSQVRAKGSIFEEGALLRDNEKSTLAALRLQGVEGHKARETCGKQCEEGVTSRLLSHHYTPLS